MRVGRWLNLERSASAVEGSAGKGGCSQRVCAVPCSPGGWSSTNRSCEPSPGNLQVECQSQGPEQQQRATLRWAADLTRQILSQSSRMRHLKEEEETTVPVLGPNGRGDVFFLLVLKLPN